MTCVGFDIIIIFQLIFPILSLCCVFLSECFNVIYLCGSSRRKVFLIVDFSIYHFAKPCVQNTVCLHVHLEFPQIDIKITTYFLKWNNGPHSTKLNEMLIKRSNFNSWYDGIEYISWDVYLGQIIQEWTK